MERQRSRIYLPEEDVTPVANDPKTGEPKEARFFAQYFKKQTPDMQIRCGYVCVEQHNVDPNYVVSWITEDWAREQFRVWCIGKGVEISEDRRNESTGRRETTDTLLAQDQEMINALHQSLGLRDLAEIRTARRYQTANEDERQFLVGGSYRLLGEYLGRTRTYRRSQDKPPFLPLPDLPIELFEDNFISGILWESQRIKALELYTQSFGECMDFINGMKGIATHPAHISFVQRLEDYFEEVEAQEFPMFNQLIAGSFKDVPEEEEITLSPFPSNHQKEYAYNFTHKEIDPIDLLNGGTATQKTGGAICAMAKAGAEATLVVCPPGIPRVDWVREIREKYKDPVDIVMLTGLNELRSYLNHNDDRRPKFIVVGYTLLSSIDTASDRNDLVEALTLKTGRDSLVFDESHLSKELSAQCTRVLFDISRLLPEQAPRIGMTATSVVNSVEDLDSPIRILRPYRYPTPGSFTVAARNEPYLVSSLLHSQRLLTTWEKEVILRDKLPQVEHHDIPVPFTPFHQKLYEFVLDEYENDLPEGRTKRTMLRQTSLDPLLVKRYFSPTGIRKEIYKLERRLETKQDDTERQIIENMIEGLRERTRRVAGMYDTVTAQTALLEAHEQYQRWVITQNPDEVFDEDFLVKLGFDRLALWAFLNLPNSVDTLVTTSDNVLLRQDWEGKHGLFSSKYIRLKQDLDRYAAAGDTKVLIFSGFYMTGVTTDAEEMDEVDEEGFKSLYQLLKNWYGEEHVAKIDGSVSTEPKRGKDSEREKIRKRFRLDPNLWFLLLTSRSSRLGINLTIPPTKANSGIKKVVQKNLDDPDTAADKDQQEGRSVRPGQLIPVDIDTYRATHNEYPTTLRYGFIDQGIAEALTFKRLISQMVLSGIPLTPEEERFVRERMIGSQVQQLYPITPREYLMRTFYPTVRGKGYRRNREFLKSLGFEGGTNADFYAANYPLIEELGIAGHNARLVTQVIRRYKELSSKDRLRIASAGSGTGVLQAMLGEPLINIDMMEEMLQVGRTRFSGQGRIIAGDIAHLPLRSESLDVLDASLVIHWTDYRGAVRRDNRLISERALALEELIRTVKTGGLVTISVPYSHLTNELFTRWIQAFELFGARQMAGLPSGLVRATDFRQEPVSWVFNLEKAGEPIQGIDYSLFEFDFDRLFVDNESNRRRGRDRIVGINLPLPHYEFEVVNPDGEIDKVTFVDTSIEDELERVLSGDGKHFRTGADVLTQLGHEEYGMHRRLIREARSKWGLNVEQAERLSLETIDLWSKEGFERFNARNIWAELLEIAEELKERNN